MQSSPHTSDKSSFDFSSRETLIPSATLATVLSKSVRTLQNWRTLGQGPAFVRTGGQGVLYKWGDVSDWLEDNKVNSTSEEVAA